MISAPRFMLALTILLLSTVSYAVPPTYTLQTGIGSINIDSDSDTYFYLTGNAQFSRSLSNYSILDLIGEVSIYEYSDSDDISSEELFFQGTYSYTPRAGYRVPTYSLGLRLREEMVSGDGLDATTLLILAGIDYRIDDRTKIWGGLKLGQRDADGTSDVYGIFANLDIQYLPDWLLYSTLGSDQGADSIRSYCGGGFSSGSGYGYGSSSMDFDTDDCDDLYLTLGANYAIDAFQTLDFSATFHNYDVPGDSVSGEFYSVDYFYRF